MDLVSFGTINCLAALMAVAISVAALVEGGDMVVNVGICPDCGKYGCL